MVELQNSHRYLSIWPQHHLPFLCTVASYCQMCIVCWYSKLQEHGLQELMSETCALTCVLCIKVMQPQRQKNVLTVSVYSDMNIFIEDYYK